VQRLIVLVLPEVEILDLAGPLQVFHEANLQGADYRTLICAPEPRVHSDQGIWLADLAPLPAPEEGDLILVPGCPLAALESGVPGERRTGSPSAPASRVEPAVLAWLAEAAAAGAHFASVCTGAFVLGRAGLLDGRQCTTHWTRLDDLAHRFPAARVLAGRLFVEDGPVLTSAGIASGIDLALALVERRHGPHLTSRVAREMVVYLRRDGAHPQTSVYLDHRAHLHPGVHRVQDWLIAHPEERATLTQLADLAALSPRHLTRVFREATGVTVQDYATRLRLERARSLLQDPHLTIEAVAARCGFETARQLRRLWKEAFGTTPSAARGRVSGETGPPHWKR